MEIFCKVCAAPSTGRLLFKAKSAEVGDLVRCARCGVKFVDPCPSDSQISSYYNGMYKEFAVAFDDLKLQHAKSAIEGYVKILEGVGEWPKAKFLDLGGGLGYYSLAAKQLGLNVTLIDLDPVSTAFAKDVLGIEEVFHGYFHEFYSHLESKFDFILCRHVIEHFGDPEVVPQAIDRFLARDGVAIIETDNNASIELLVKPEPAKFYFGIYQKNYHGVSLFRLLVQRPFALDPPRHLFSYSVSSLVSLFRRFDFATIYRRTYVLGDKRYWPNVKQADVRSTLKSLLNRNYRLFSVRLKDLFFYPIRRFLNVFMLGAGIQIVVKKKE